MVITFLQTFPWRAAELPIFFALFIYLLLLERHLEGKPRDSKTGLIGMRNGDVVRPGIRSASGPRGPGGLRGTSFLGVVSITLIGAWLAGSSEGAHS